LYVYFIAYGYHFSKYISISFLITIVKIKGIIKVKILHQKSCLHTFIDEISLQTNL